MIGRKGRIFQYEEKYDRFKMIYKLPEATDVISYGYLDRNSNIWLCSNDSILLYNTETAQTLQFPNVLDENITVVEQADDTHFFVATEMGVRYTQLNKGALHIIPFETLDNVYTQINGLYYHRPTPKGSLLVLSVMVLLLMICQLNKLSSQILLWVM